MVNAFSHSQPRIPSLPRSLLVGILATAGVLGGLVPTVEHPAAAPTFSIAAYAQTLSRQEVQNYARSVMAIEPLRQKAYDDIRRIMGARSIPEILCHRPESLASLPGNVRQIATDYCTQAIRIVERNDLTIEDFNRITVSLRSNPALASQIQQEMLRLQNSN